MRTQRAAGGSAALLLGCVLMATFFRTPASATEIVPLSLSKLSERAQIVALGQVESVKRLDPVSDEVVVKPVTPIKGKLEQKPFTLQLRTREAFGFISANFDPELKVGDKGVFFLKSLRDGRAELAFWGSIALFPRKGGSFFPMAADELVIGSLVQRSAFIVLGQIAAVREIDAASVEVRVAVAVPLLDQDPPSDFSFRLQRSVLQSDSTLRSGAKGVFFLRSVENGKGELAQPGSVAGFHKHHNFVLRER